MLAHRKFENASIETNDSILHTGDFEKLLLEAIDESFSSLGESAKRSIYFRLEKSFSIKKENIPNRLVAFAQAIEKIFGSGANLLEISIMKKLHEKVGTNFEWDKLKSFGFAGYITETKRYFQEKNRVNIQYVPKVLAKNQRVSVEGGGEQVL